MLIITRKINDSFFINGREIEVKVLGIQGYQVKIGISAPENILILREEVLERIEKNGNQAKTAA